MVKKKYNEATTVASCRSRLGKKGNNKPLKPGEAAQRDFLKNLLNALGGVEGVSISIDGSERVPIKEIKKRLN